LRRHSGATGTLIVLCTWLGGEGEGVRVRVRVRVRARVSVRVSVRVRVKVRVRVRVDRVVHHRVGRPRAGVELAEVGVARVVEVDRREEERAWLGVGVGLGVRGRARG
jgi:hypothetical protein